MAQLTEEALRAQAIAQIRDALVTLFFASVYEDEAQVALDALDWLEANTDVRV